MKHSLDEEVAAPAWPSLSLLLEDVLSSHGPLEALVDGSKRLTFSDLGALVPSMSSALQQLGLKRGDRVALWGGNDWRWEVTAMACWWSGLIVAPISSRLKSLEVLPLLHELRPGALFAGNDNRGNSLLDNLTHHLEEAGDTPEQHLPDILGFVDFGSRPATSFLLWDRLLHKHSSMRPRACNDIGADETCMIIYTSGTTGRPKGVASSNGAILRAFLPNTSSIERPGDRFLLTAPLSHMYGQYIMIRSLSAGVCQVLGTGGTAAEVSRLVREENITLLSGAPSLFQELLMDRPDGATVLDGVRKISTGGAPVSEKLVTEMRNTGVEFVQVGFGLTECSRVCSTIRDDSIEDLCTTVGHTRPGMRLKVADDEGRELPEGEVGEILIAGSLLMQGYWGKGGVIDPATDAQGWFHTGDLGRIVKGDLLQIAGRKKDMFISHGFNVYPAEVENLLLKSGLLRQVAVLSRTSRLAGEEGVAIVVPRDAKSFELRELRNWAHRNLANYKVPARFIVTDALPLNANGKVDRLAIVATHLRETDRKETPARQPQNSAAKE